MIITISGNAGSGKSTAADILAEKLNMKKYSVGNYRREMAKKLGLNLEQFNELGEKQDFTDKKADEWQIQLGKNEDNFIIEGRLSYHFIPHSIKIFLDASEEEAARRIRIENRLEEKVETDEQALLLLKKRKASDIKRYVKYYGINPYDISQYDLVIDTSHIKKEETIKKILDFLEKQKA